MYPCTAIENTLIYGLETLKVRSAVGLPLFCNSAKGLGLISDMYSGFSMELCTIAVEMAILKAYGILSEMSLNELPPFIEQ